MEKLIHQQGRLTRKNRREAKNQTVTEQHPQCFVITRGNAGPTLSKLMQDFRTVMEPNTASRLRVSVSCQV